MYVTWTNEIDVFLARSTDYGANFTTEAVDQDSRSSAVGNSQACISGSLIVIAYEYRSRQREHKCLGRHEQGLRRHLGPKGAGTP